MKVNRKVLAAAVALALGSASTAFADPIPYNGIFFSAFDAANNTSIIVNLNLGVANFRANPTASYTLAGSGLTGLQNWLSTANSSQVQWTVMGVFDDGTGGNIPPSALYGGVSTSTNIESITPDWGSFGGLDATVTQTPTFLNTVNPFMASNNYYSVANASAFKFASQDGGAAFEGRSTVGSAMSFYNFGADPDNSFFGGVYSKFVGSWALNFTGNQASLTYSGAPSVVPIPAAVWLLGSGLLGLVGIGRRKQVVAA